MTGTSGTSGSGGFDRALRTAGAALAAAWLRHERTVAAREAEHRLRTAPDAILQDIGIGYDDIGAAVRNGRERYGWR